MIYFYLLNSEKEKEFNFCLKDDLSIAVYLTNDSFHRSFISKENALSFILALRMCSKNQNTHVLAHTNGNVLVNQSPDKNYDYISFSHGYVEPENVVISYYSHKAGLLKSQVYEFENFKAEIKKLEKAYNQIKMKEKLTESNSKKIKDYLVKEHSYQEVLDKF